MWAREVSIESTCSTIIFFNSPDDLDSTSPNGILKSFLEISFLISPNELKVAVWEILVDIPAVISFNTYIHKIIMQQSK